MLQLFDNVQAVLFDMDGVIVDSANLHNWAKREALESYNIYIEDSEWGNIQDLTSAQTYQSGKSAGCIVLGKINMNSKEELLNAGTDAVFENFKELLK
ncbi:MAG: hypothetical protein NTU76_00935 [Candidatus Taylorbacteria bacterium]|nr:hypothetical protein [Candidatus Taylorbacteria bacterium]